MAKQLIIAEKPSVAADLARVLGKKFGKLKKDEAAGGFSNDSLIITSAVGHLVEQKKPQTPDGKSLPWKMEFLPIMPDSMELEPIPKSADRLRKILKLARSKEVGSLVNACDAGREGELIFRNIVRFGNIRKPVSRLWMQSMTDDSILEAWAALKSDEEMRCLADAAVCRSESDWLVGLNSTRALTVLQSAAGGFHVTPTGRVQTPTLALLAARQKEVLAFCPETYHEVRASFSTPAGSAYTGKWYDAAWKRDDKHPQRTRERLWDAATAAAIAARCQGRPARVTEQRKPVSMPPPLLFDLTSLQKEASNRFGFSASRTLQIAQECYEKHKVLTYPRTDSKYLPNDYLRVVKGTVAAIGEQLSDFSAVTADILARGIRPSKRVFDSAKVSDHFAIIPTGKFVNLTGDALRIFTLVVQRFLGVFMPNAEFEDTERTTIVSSPGAEDHFLTHGRVQLQAGWRILYASSDRKKKDELCPVKPGDEVRAEQVEAVEDQTKPPAAYTEATLLTAMETAGKLVEDDDLAYAMKERGLGTPATRASIIEGLLAQEYIARDGKDLVATRRGMDLIDLLRKIGLSTLSSPELTGEWEYRLKQMENGKLLRSEFMEAIRSYTAEIVYAVREYMHQGKNPDLTVRCPACKEEGLTSRIDAVSCKHCKFHLRRVHAGLSLSDEQMGDLLTHGELPLMDGFRSKFGKFFRAGLRLVAPASEKGSWKTEFYFDTPDPAKSAEGSAAVSLGLMPVQGQGELEVQETERQWIVPDFVQGKDKKGFTLSRVILGRELDHDVLRRVLAEGKSELIKGFTSQRTHKPFDAFLVLDAKKGNVKFEFPPRESAERKPRTPRRAASAEAEAQASPDAPAPKPENAQSFGAIKVKGKGEHELLLADDGWHVDGLVFGKNRKPLVIPATMCEAELTAELVTHLLTKGKSPLIKDFVSRKSGKKFEAYLVFNSTSGRITYEFPPRK